MDIYSLPPGEKNRILATLKQDAQYKKSRNTLLMVSAICVVCLAIVGLMVKNDSMTMWAAVAILGICVAAYIFSAIRAVRGRKAALSRAMYAQSEKAPSRRKEKRKGRGGKAA